MHKLQQLSYLAFLEAKRTFFGVKYFAEIDITDNCNLRCKHCYHFNGKSKFRTKELPIEAWKQRFDEIRKKGVRFVLLVGGEPALRKDILMLADKTFPFVYVITNGTIKITEEFNHLLFVSLDGMEQKNDAIRGKGVFSRAIQNYSGDKRVAINMTITNDNYKDLENVVCLAKENGLRGVVCNICASGTNVQIPMHIKRNERIRIIDELRRVKSLYPQDFLLSKSMINWYASPDHRRSCYWGDEVLHFDVSWKKRRCFGSNADCSNCGCLAGSMQNPLSLLLSPREMVKMV